MKKMKVVLPQQQFKIVSFQQGDMPGVASINVGLVDYNRKQVFRWHLSLVFEAKVTDRNKLPTDREAAVFNDLEDKYQAIDIGADSTVPNGLFLARISWNETVEFIWRLHDPQIVHEQLSIILQSQSYSRPFDYRIDDDPTWSLSTWHLHTALK